MPAIGENGEEEKMDTTDGTDKGPEGAKEANTE